MKSAIARISLLLVVFGGCISTVAAKNEWIQVRSKNFLLIGNASEKEVRSVAQHLERFRFALSRLFNNADLSSARATNVVVFRDEASYTPYKPLKRDGKIDLSVQGYFESGQDVNYITVEIGHGEEQAYRTIFHEYVHFVVSALYPKAEVPAWFNEGLAEYYSTFTIDNNGGADVGSPIKDHVNLLEKNTLLPLDTLFPLRSSEINNSSAFSRLLFYAESWALVHYLISSGRDAELNVFIKSILDGTPQEQAFRKAFRQDYRAMETALRSYVDQKKFDGRHIDLRDTTVVDPLPAATTLSPPVANAYLGDLLYHIDRPAEAEVSLLSALSGDPTIDIANADLGMIRFQQQRFDEARKYLEIAARSEHTSAPILYRYAYVLSRENIDESGNSREYEPATLKKMRDALHRAIVAGPALTESYDLLAAIDLDVDENLDEAADAMQTALHYEPGRNDYALRLADVYVRQKKYDLARAIADRVSQYGGTDLQRRANAILNYIREETGYSKNAADQPPLGPRTDPPMTRAEVDEANARSTLRSINGDLRVPGPGEIRVVGTIEHIDCSQAKVRFTIHAADRDLTLSSSDFQRLILRTFDKDAAGVQIGCETQMNARTVVVTYKEQAVADVREMVAIEFVPSDFRLLTADEMVQPRAHLVREDQVDSEGYSLKDRSPQRGQDVAAHLQPDASRNAILAVLGKTPDGENRTIGYLQGIECGSEFYLLIRTRTGILRLKDPPTQPLLARSFVAELPQLAFTCATIETEYPLVVTYKQSADGSSVITSVTIVPRDFVLD